ncbi:hypothetical protein [Mucilaginibacter sp. OK098]|uniref:hypothetical protein n=1 Tax=Mucilaginibacter sp. OK098 TaxID=1855297 RepID=UPI00090F24F3|nr:hypothetical protein [Mucilaginibacter sp. OK098]SHN28428.1 hypothetical protein SAMN05216524_108147 [Mucilaginibacter sp. OK098]
MKLKRAKLISLLIFMLLLSVTGGHFLPPFGVLFSPIIMSLMTYLILFTHNSFKILAKSVLSYLCIGLNDVGIKLFAGGVHDFEGMGFVHLLLFIGLAPCLVMLLMAVKSDEHSNKWIKVLSIVVFILLIYIHIQLFQTLGIVKSRYI